MQPDIEMRNDESHLYLSAKTGAGMELLQDKLLETIGWHQETGVFMARARHLEALARAEHHLDSKLNTNLTGLSYLPRNCAKPKSALNSITGEFSADDLLGEIFSRFCIGK